MNGLIQMYEDEGVGKYYQASLVQNYATRYTVFSVIIGILGWPGSDHSTHSVDALAPPTQTAHARVPSIINLQLRAPTAPFCTHKFGGA